MSDCNKHDFRRGWRQQTECQECLEDRIQSLDLEIDHLKDALCNALGNRSEIIDRYLAGEHLVCILSKDQIDTAWSMGSLYGHDAKHAIVTALKYLGIYPCMVCHENQNASSLEWGEGALQCSACEGHGWVIKDAR